MHWKGKAENNYPWGKETDYESLAYDVDDAHPESAQSTAKRKASLNATH